jgi:DNA-binding MarR family transcriptional regulator
MSEAHCASDVSLRFPPILKWHWSCSLTAEEGKMIGNTEDIRHESPSEARLVTALRRSGPQTIEALSSISGLSWSQVFLAVDRLSRAGEVALQRLPSSHYQVSVK